RFEAAAAFSGVHAEAHVRGGWILFQQGRSKEALEWLDAAKPGEDRELTYWLNLFRGRVLAGLARGQESADAYRAAIGLYPGAQSAGVGLALQLFAIDQASQADDVARTLRRGTGRDPWTTYAAADSRFIGEFVTRLRKAIQ